MRPQRLAQSGEELNLQRRHATGTAIARSRSTPTGASRSSASRASWFAIERENLRVAMANALEQDARASAARDSRRMALLDGVRDARGRVAVAAPRPCGMSRCFRGARARPVRDRRFRSRALGRSEEALPLGQSIADIGRRDEDPVRRAEAAHLHCLLAWLAAEWDTIDQLFDSAEHRSSGPAAHAGSS